MDVRCCYASCGCNRSPFAADWGQNDLLAYGSCNAVIICQPKFPARVIQTLTGHTDRVNSVHWLTNPKNVGNSEVVSASTDKTAVVWQKQGDNFQLLSKLEGHTATVTTATGIYVGDHANPSQGELSRTLIATASVDSTVKIWLRKGPTDEFSCVQTLSFGSGFALDLSWITLPHTAVPLLACGGDDQKIHLLAEHNEKFVPVQTLVGHEDWIRALDFTVDDSGDVLLASCAQDHYIRIWRLSARQNQDSPNIENIDLNTDIRMKETTFTIQNKDTNLRFAVTLESVLHGHEGWIYSVRWHPPVVKDDIDHQPLALLSASMDKTMIIWRPDEETGVWVEQVRVGDVGGNSLGFYGGMFGADGHSLLSHGYQGAFSLWQQQQDSSSWLPGVTVGGHFASVHDVAWEPEGGQFLLSVSQDQTTRLHGYWNSQHCDQKSWHELARPQVHGYDMQCLAMINRWSFASGADEKVIRVFEAPRNFMDNISHLSNIHVEESAKAKSSCPQGASVPALGLSNKAVYKDSNEPPSDDRVMSMGSNTQYPELYFSPLSLEAPPSEDNLIQNTLWPEIQKLYGHGYEIYTLAYHPRSNILASACKAAKAEHASILLWDTSSWRQVCKLDAHTLTITQLMFSHSGEYLLSVSRDRTWSLYRCRQQDQPHTDAPYNRVAFTDKQTSIHTRIIWAAAWSHDDLYFVTVARDKKAVIWSKDGDEQGDGCHGNYVSLGKPLSLQDSITAVDFAPCKTESDCYLLAFGLDNGSIHIYKWSDKDASDVKIQSWTQLSVLNQSMAHHLSVKRLQFRPVVGVVCTESSSTSSLTLQLASCGSDHAVKIYVLKDIS